MTLSEEALAEYLDESSEMIERIGVALSTLEHTPDQPDLISSLYRDVHTIKGSSQLFGFNLIGRLAHTLESCLDPVRRGQAALTPALTDVTLAAVDLMTRIIGAIRREKKEPDLAVEVAGIIGELVAAPIEAKPATTELHAAPKAAPKPAPQPAVASRATRDRDLPPMPEKPLPGPPATVKPAEKTAERTAGPGQARPVTSGGEMNHPAPARTSAAAPAATPVATPETLAPAAAVPAVTATQAPVAAAPASGSTPAHGLPRQTGGEPAGKPAVESQQNETVRINVMLLDTLMNLVGELVLIRNQLLQRVKTSDDVDFQRIGQRLNVVTGELQTEVMKTRTQPIGNILNKFTRIVRDLARDLGKSVELETEGGDTELDKTLIEAVKDPLTHIVRNAVDHGIESPEDRRKAGKRPQGLVRVRAFHESGQVIIEIIDDGRGLDRRRIEAKAVERGLATAEAAARMSDREVFAFIFLPGFSTAKVVTDVSGRGVGMDVVKTNIERIGGAVDVTSVLGQGTTLRLKIPLTLAIIPALIVREENARFAIPQVKLVELIRVDGDSSGMRVERLQGQPILRLRGRVLPLVRLRDVLRLGQAAAGGGLNDAFNVVVLNADGHKFGLIVDAIDDSADIVIKSLPGFLSDLGIYSGATVMGDGAVALTLDVTGLAEKARVTRTSTAAEVSGIETTAQNRQDHSEFLLIDLGIPGNFVIPLPLVHRLEEFPASEIETAGKHQVMRYRNELLVLVDLRAVLGFGAQPSHAAAAADTRIPVIVMKRGDRLLGMAVHAIQDIVNVAARIETTLGQTDGLLGTVIDKEHGRTLVVVDPYHVMDRVLGRQRPAVAGQGPRLDNGARTLRAGRRILVVDDSGFFRNRLRGLLGDAGYTVEVARDGADAWRTLDQSCLAGQAQAAGETGQSCFNLVLSDIEMPVMTGLDLVRKVKGEARFQRLPMVALSSKATPADQETGRAAGFDQYLEKLDPDQLLSVIDSLLKIA